MLGEVGNSGWEIGGNHVLISLTLYKSAGPQALPVCVPNALLPPWGSEPSITARHALVQVTTVLTQLSPYRRSAGNMFLPVSALLKVFMFMLIHSGLGPRPRCPSIF